MGIGPGVKVIGEGDGFDGIKMALGVEIVCVNLVGGGIGPWRCSRFGFPFHQQGEDQETQIREPHTRPNDIACDGHEDRIVDATAMLFREARPMEFVQGAMQAEIEIGEEAIDPVSEARAEGHRGSSFREWRDSGGRIGRRLLRLRKPQRCVSSC